jgi:hypothetical protein
VTAMWMTLSMRDVLRHPLMTRCVTRQGPTLLRGLEE